VLETLTKGFTAARERLAGVRALSEENVAESLRDVRMSLLEADVDLAVVRDFLARVKERVLGEKVETHARDAAGRTARVTPGQHFVKACHDELVALMGPVDASLARADGRTSVMLVGLQGVGKTTVAGKLARRLQPTSTAPPRRSSSNSSARASACPSCAERRATPRRPSARQRWRALATWASTRSSTTRRGVSRSTTS
jgi:signal recognition particle subunit SRP54